MSLSSKAAVGAGALVGAAGILATFLTPLAGLAAGGYLTYGAVAATSTAGATIGWTALGAFGGLIVGKIASPLVMLATVGLAAATAGVVKLAGAGLGAVAGLFSKKSPEQKNNTAAVFERSSSLRDLPGLAQRFDAAKDLSNDNQIKTPAPKNDKKLRF